MEAGSGIRAYLMVTGSGPILVLSSYSDLTDQTLLDKLRYKGIADFISYEVDLAAVEERYGDAYRTVVDDLSGLRDISILDFNGHQIMANFSLSELGEPVKFGD